MLFYSFTLLKLPSGSDWSLCLIPAQLRPPGLMFDTSVVGNRQISTASIAEYAFFYFIETLSLKKKDQHLQSVILPCNPLWLLFVIFIVYFSKISFLRLTVYKNAVITEEVMQYFVRSLELKLKVCTSVTSWLSIMVMYRGKITKLSKYWQIWL